MRKIKFSFGKELYHFKDTLTAKNDILFGIILLRNQVIPIFDVSQNPEGVVRFFMVSMINIYIGPFAILSALKNEELTEEDVIQIAERRKQRQDDQGR